MTDKNAPLHAIRRAALGFAALATLLMLALTAGHPAGVMAATKPTPVPGGANQIAGVNGKLGAVLFNGQLRIRKMTLRLATADEETADPGNTAVTFEWIFVNGTHKPIYGNTSASIADTDGILVDGHSVGVYGAYYSMQPGAPARLKIRFQIPNGFNAVKILLVPGSGPAFRIALKPSDMPKAAPTPAMSPTP